MHSGDRAEHARRAADERTRRRLEAEAERISRGQDRGRPLSRRTFVLGSLAGGAMWTTAIAAEGTPIAAPAATPIADLTLADDPFTLGVASGDPAPDGVVLWTRLAPRPFEPGGGLPPAPIEVAYEIATDEGMTAIVQQGTALAEAAYAHSVHLEVAGLEPARWYWYRFRIGGYDSPIGRTKTAPAAGQPVDGLRFAFASCQRWEHGLFTAFRDLAAQDVDLVVHLGDYIYEYSLPSALRFRDVGGVPNKTETRDLDDYRMRYALYKLDPHLREAHRLAPWLVTWDDHEVSNNYTTALIEDSPFSRPLVERREAAYQAAYEHQPLRATARPRGRHLRLYRDVTFGDLVRFNVLDTRQYRSPNAGNCGDAEREANGGFCDAALDPARTMLGDAQKRWLLDGFGTTDARWSVLANQVPFARIDFDPSPQGKSFGGETMDKWDGYAAERDEVLAAMADAAEARGFAPVVITGDVHANFVWDLKRDWDAPGAASVVGTEFVGTSIASNGDAPLREDGVFTTFCGNLRGQEHNRLYDNHRGYVLCELTADQWRAAYRVLPTVEDPDAEASTQASFVVEHERPGAQTERCDVS